MNSVARHESICGFIAITLAMLSFFSQSALSATSLSTPLPQKLPTSLPSKANIKKTRPAERRTLPENYNAVVVKPTTKSELSAAIRQSQEELTQVTLKSRKTVPAPPGDLSEFPRSEDPKPGKTAAAQTLIPTGPPTVMAPTATSKASAEPAPRVVSQSISPIAIAEQMTAADLELPAQEPSASEQIAQAHPSTNLEPPNFSTSVETLREQTRPAASTLAFFRVGYLKSKFSEFDSRMKDGATSFGLGVSHLFRTDFGALEARAAVDVFHATDQTIAIDTIRILSTRTEATYWLTEARVKPGLSLAFGWTEYSVRTLHHLEGTPAEQITVRTHAKSQAFSVIPGTALRITAAEGLMIDVQTEYLALLGGDDSGPVQGLGGTISLGWHF